MDYNSVASLLLAQLRDEAGLTQNDIARALGVTQSTISKFERGEMTPDLNEVRAYCDAVRIPFPEFALRLESAYQRSLT